jgi:hypothetical protein
MVPQRWHHTGEIRLSTSRRLSVGIRRHVQLSDEFVIIAEEQFPPDGSEAEGATPYSVFAATVLKNAMEAFGQDFEAHQIRPGIASFSTSETVFIRKPMRFFARLIRELDVVEIIDVDVDWDYVDMDLVLDEEERDD